MRTRVLALLLASMFCIDRSPAEEITWISLNQVDAVDPADHGFTDILAGAGHNITRFFFDGGTVLGQSDIDAFNASDLVIVGKASNSGDYDDDSLVFNEDITSPLLMMSGYISRMNRFGWVTGNGLTDTSGPSQLVAEDPAHPVFKGIEFEADGVTTVNPYNFQIDRGISTATDPPITGGTTIATSVEIANGLVAAEWPAGTAVVTDDGTNPNQTLAGDRYLFLAGSREAAGNPINTSAIDLTPDGRRLFLNMVHYTFGDVPDLGDFNRDGMVDASDYNILGGSIFGHLDGPVGFANGDMDMDLDVDINDFNQFKALFPAAVAAAQGVPEPSTLGLMALMVGAMALARGSLAKLRRTAPILLLAAACMLVAGSSVHAQVETFWTATGSSDYNTPSNWSGGFPPAFDFPAMEGEIGVISNGGTAVLDLPPFAAAGAIVLGQGAGESGALEIVSGGELATDATNLPDGSVTVGLDGEGHLTVQGGMLTTAGDLSSGGAAGSSITLGGAATVTVNGNANLGRTTRITGPDVAFSVGSLNLGNSHTLIAEITGATHSAITASQAATLGGSIEVEFNGVTPSVGDSWTLVNANYIGGGAGILSVSSSGFTPDPGHGVVAEVTSTSLALTYDARLQLTVDPDDGNAAIQNLTTEAIDFDGYGIISIDGGINTGGWTSIAASGDGDWSEFNPAANHISELNLISARSLAPGASVGLGQIFAAPGANGLSGVGFSYSNAGGSAVQGLLAIGDVDIMPPPMGVPGDYNNNGTVEQADLDLVLLNWGASFDTLPPEWINERPEMGIVAQAQLDGVLLNWGATAGAALGAAAGVPEPATCLIAILACPVLVALRKRG